MRSWVVFLLVACSSSASAPTRTSPAQPAAQRDARAIDTTPPPTTAPAEQPTRKAIEPLPTACAPKEKLFRCHALALAAHLGIDRPAEPAAARALYADACSKGYAPSCNNLAVLATMHSELATGLDTASLWAMACKKLDLAACDNARRVQQHRELAVKLTLGDTLSPELKAAACRIGDVFQCDDAASRQKLGALLAEECRGGQREQCFDAANSTQDSAAALELMTLACKQRDGRACHALAKRKLADGAQPAAVTAYWKTACSDDNFNIGPDAIAARNEACDAWSSAVKSPRDLLAIAKLTQPRCENDDQGACTTTTRVLDRAGASARAFALVKRMCQGTSDDSAACLDLADRYALGRGTARSVAKRIELRGEACTPPTSWEVCKVVAEYEARRPELADAAVTIHASFCEAKINEACYLGARAAEAAKSWCTGPWDGVRALRDAYGALCKAKVSDACKREASMCTLAQREFLEPRPTCGGGGVGDGTFQPTAEYTALIELCPKDTWSKDVQREMAKLEAYRKSLEAAPR